MGTNTIFSCCFKLQIMNTPWKGALDPSAKFYWFHALIHVWWWSFVCITDQSQCEKQIIVLSQKKNCCEAHLNCCETRQWIFSFSAFMKSSVFWSVCKLLCKSYDIRYLSTNHLREIAEEREREREDDCLTLFLCATTLLFNRVFFDCQVQKFHVILSEMVDVLVVDTTTFRFWSSISESMYKSCGFKEIELLQLAQSRVAAQCLPCC